METKGMLQNSVTYKGKVKIKYKRNNKVYELDNHNTGTKFLGDTISMALAGEDVSLRIPKYLDFIYRYDDNDTRLLSSLIPFTSIVYGDSVPNASSAPENAGLLFLSATILPEDIIANFDVSSSNVHLYLQMKSITGDLLAELTGEDLKTMYNMLITGTQAIVEWNMQFLNGTEE